MELTSKGYTLGGVDLLSVAKEFGSPLYVYDSDQIVANYHQLKMLFQE